MTDTVNLGLPCIEGGQAQKHVTHNEALRILDALVQLAVLDRDLTAPPASPAEGQRWIVKAGATGLWAGHDNAIAAWQDGGWLYSAPKTGWVAFVADEGTLLVWNGTAWGDFFSTVTSIQNLARLGIGTTADATNPLSGKFNNALFAAQTVAEGGDGNMRYKLSKESAAKTASLLFQDNYSGRAEMGLAGDDDFHLKVSADGSSWSEALVANRSAGRVYFPNAIRLGADAAANQLDDYEEGTWTPALGTIRTGDLAAATSFDVIYGRYTKIGQQVTVHCAFKVNGLSTVTFTQKSALAIIGLPFAVRDDSGSIDYGGVSGFVYQSIGGAQVSMLGGGVSASTNLYVFVFYTGVGEARNTDNFYICATYHTND
ncbi:MAG: DUF2793 domain-containing protein [Pseudolabrys sp.]